MKTKDNQNALFFPHVRAQTLIRFFSSHPNHTLQRLLESAVISKTNYIKQRPGFYQISPRLANIIRNENKIKIYLYTHFKIGMSTKRFVYFRIYLFILFLHTCMFPASCFCQRTHMAHSLVNGVLNETWTHSCLQFDWFSVGYGFIQRSSSLFLRVCLP